MQDENGLWSGYGYEMMQGIAKYMQCTFSYVGYDKTAKECEEMLQKWRSRHLYGCQKDTGARGGVCIFPPSGDHRIYEHERGDTELAV